MSVMINTQRPESTLNKKSNLMCYHVMCKLLGYACTIYQKAKIISHIHSSRKRLDWAIWCPSISI